MQRGLIRGAAGQSKPSGIVPRTLVDRFPGATWTPLSYAHPSRTWRIDDGTTMYLKVSGAAVHAGVGDERQRLRWAAGKLPVPAVIDADETDGIEWMQLAALRGSDGTDPRLLSHPARLVHRLASALRQLHDTPASGCPFDFRIPAAMAHVEARLRGGEIKPSEFKPAFGHYTAEAAVAELRAWLPAGEDPVLTHGDYCAQNIIFDADQLSGFVDVGALAIADRWRDLAVATWSLEWNIGPGYEDLLLRAYGVEPDPTRMQFYRLLYELES